MPTPRTLASAGGRRVEADLDEASNATSIDTTVLGGIGYSQHRGHVAVADDTQEIAPRMERALTNDSGIGITRHADAGYREAVEFARKSGGKIPML